MAPKTMLQKIRETKKPKSILDDDPKYEDKTNNVFSVPHASTSVNKVPPVTDEERERWIQIRAHEEWVNGVPKVGWPAHIATMKADGRLYLMNNTLHWRGR